MPFLIKKTFVEFQDDTSRDDEAGITTCPGRFERSGVCELESEVWPDLLTEDGHAVVLIGIEVGAPHEVYEPDEQMSADHDLRMRAFLSSYADVLIEDIAKKRHDLCGFTLGQPVFWYQKDQFLVSVVL